jgi:hypothetical protein
VKRSSNEQLFKQRETNPRKMQKVRHAPFGHDSNRALFDFFHINVFILDENFLHVAIFVFKLALYGNFVNKEN